VNPENRAPTSQELGENERTRRAEIAQHGTLANLRIDFSEPGRHCESVGGRTRVVGLRSSGLVLMGFPTRIYPHSIPSHVQHEEEQLRLEIGLSSRGTLFNHSFHVGHYKTGQCAFIRMIKLLSMLQFAFFWYEAKLPPQRRYCARIFLLFILLR
jgi:hypothetical protein